MLPTEEDVRILERAVQEEGGRVWDTVPEPSELVVCPLTPRLTVPSHPPAPPPHTPVRTVRGTITQTSYPWYKPTAWACGPIAIQACVLSEWVDPRCWHPQDVDSITLCGLWHARRYSGAAEGQADMMKQVRGLCPEMQYKVTDVLDVDTLFTEARDTCATRRYFVTTGSASGHSAGHHTFLMHADGFWFWLEPLEGTLRVFDADLYLCHHMQRVGLFEPSARVSILRVRSSRWSVVPRVSAGAPRTVVDGSAAPATPRPDGPVVLTQCPQSLGWRSRELGGRPCRLTFRAKPNFTCIVLFDAATKDRIDLGTCKTFEDQRPLSGHAVPVAVSARATPVWVCQSPFLDPCVWVTPRGVRLLVGSRGSSILPYVRVSRKSEDVNCAPLLDLSTGRLQVVLTRDICSGGELIRPPI